MQLHPWIGSGVVAGFIAFSRHLYRSCVPHAPHMYCPAGKELEGFIPKSLKDFEELGKLVAAKHLLPHARAAPASYKAAIKSLLKVALATMAAQEVKDLETCVAGGCRCACWAVCCAVLCCAVLCCAVHALRAVMCISRHHSMLNAAAYRPHPHSPAALPLWAPMLPLGSIHSSKAQSTSHRLLLPCPALFLPRLLAALPCPLPAPAPAPLTCHFLAGIRSDKIKEEKAAAAVASKKAQKRATLNVGRDGGSAGVPRYWLAPGGGALPAAVAATFWP